MSEITREEAERQRRGLEILKQKSEDHGADVCTLSGTPPDPDYPEASNAPQPIKANGQHADYYVLCAEERAKGYVRPVRESYKHVGAAGPRYALRDLTEDEHARYDEFHYVKFEEYPKPNPDGSSAIGRYWTQADLDNVGKGCGTTTSMGSALAETYARQPSFYSATFCCQCGGHYPVREFLWINLDGSISTERVGA